MSMDYRFAHVRRAGWPVISVFWLVWLIMAAVVLNTSLVDRLVAGLGRATGGLIGFTLVANLLMLAAVALILFGWARLRPVDVGLVWRKLPAGLLAAALIWLTLQALALLTSWLFTGGVAWHRQWSEYPTAVVIGWLLGALVGVAVVEEIGFRGFLIPQFWLRLSGKWRLVTAVILSQLLFAAMHVPQWMYEQLSGTALISRAAIALVLGILFALIYLLSDNLFVAIAFHGLHDAPTMLFASPVDQYVLVFVLELLFIVLCWIWRRRQPRPLPAAAGASLS